MNIRKSVLCLLTILALISCDDNTGIVGSSITPEEDILHVSDSIFYATSKTVLSDRQLLARGSDCYLGKFTDIETGDTMVADFITQIGCTENFEFPDSVYGIERFHFSEDVKKQMEGKKSMRANLRFYISEFIGDAENAMNIEVWPLTKTLDPNSRYYSDIDPAEYYDPSGEPLSKVTIAVTDYVVSDSIREKVSGYITNVIVPLPDSIAENILNAYYEEGGKEKFKDTESFIENLCKGYYIRCSQGDGTIMRFNKVSLEIHFNHLVQDEDTDTIKLQSSYAEFLGNSEVMQVTRFENRNIERLTEESRYTFLLTPYGLNTEITLPIDGILSDDDIIINSASMVMKALVPYQGKYALSIPQNIMLIRKGEVKDFFENLSKADNVTSFTATLDTKFNEYKFDNISRIIMKCSNERKAWIAENGYELDDTGKAAYAEEFSDWNKVIIIPIEIVKDAAGNTVYLTIDQTPKCARLCGGDLGIQIPIKTIKTEF